jgi:tetratricopeptide (TPR) repeat protein
LTPLFLQDLCTLAQQACVALFFDTYEQTDEFLDPWLREVLEGKHGDVPSNIVITIAGRHALDNNQWAAYDGLIARFPLEPFTEDEAKQYLHRKGITNPKVVEVILHLSGKLPLLVAMLAVGSPDNPDQVGDPSDTAVERFLKWVEDPKQRQVALAAALPRKFNRDVIAELAGEEDAEPLFAWLKGMPFVKEQRDGWVYHQVVRALMLRYQRMTSPKGWETAHGKLEAYFDRCCDVLALDPDKREYDPDWQRHTLEALYHNLCRGSNQHLRPALKGFLAALDTLSVFFIRWVDVIAQAGRDSESQDLQDWGQQLFEGLNAFETKDYTKAISMFSRILECFTSDIDPYWQSVALTWRGMSHNIMNSHEDALEDLNLALEMNPQYSRAFAERGGIHLAMKRYEEALDDLDRAIELKPNDMMAVARRGVAYRYMKRYEEALIDFNRCLSFKSCAGLHRDLALEPDND